MSGHCVHYQGICDHLVCPREAGESRGDPARDVSEADVLGLLEALRASGKNAIADFVKLMWNELQMRRGLVAE